jgi:diguanylate cyclase (GGDEF)-like protein/PAS domain S-box-containing protein
MKCARDELPQIALRRVSACATSPDSVPPDGLPDHMCLVNREGVVQAADAGWRAYADARYVGPAEIRVGSNYLAECDLSCELDRTNSCEFAAGLRSVLAGELEHFVMEYPRHTRAAQRWFEARITRLPGQIDLCIVAHQDVTARHRSDRDLQLLREAMNITGDAVFVIDPSEMTLVDVNGAACAMLGYSRTELLSLAPEAIFGKPRAELEVEWRGSADAQDGNLVGDARLSRADSTEVAVEIHRNVLQVGGRCLVGAVARNVSARQRADLNLRVHGLQHRLLSQFGQLALEDAPLDELLTQAAAILGQGLGIDMNRLLICGADERTLRQVAGHGWDEAWTRDRVFDAEIETANHFVIGTREAITIDDFESDSCLPRSPILIAHGVRSAVEVLICDNGRPYGFIGAYAREPGRFDADSAHFVHSISNTLAAVLDRKGFEERLSNLAQYDALTSLPNRITFTERLHNAVERVRARQQLMYAVLFVDFDRFKRINDTLGHDAGDELLRQIAERLKGALRASDMICEDPEANLVARFGGDEFLILLNDLHTAKDAERIAERLLNILIPAYSIFGNEVRSTASVGIVTSDQGHASAEEVVRNADVAMYEAKRAGRACTVVFSEAMHTSITRHVAIETSLRRAIDTAELYVLYQPIVELDTGRMVSAEALVRWNHPTLGPIAPSEFIPIAEESDLILALGKWVLMAACKMLATMRQNDPTRAPDTVSVNVSRAEVALGKRLVERVQETLASTGLPPQCLKLEVTEREVMRNPEAALEAFRELHFLGVLLAMDDFGTGTSSLALLRDYPFDVIKIDRSFLKDLTTNRDVMAVVHATIHLVDNLGMLSLAEGVEEPAQVAVLQSLGCHHAQGYYFSRPVTADRLASALESSAGARTLLTGAP